MVGQLTSVWGWYSSLEKEQYFYMFLLDGFNLIDGERWIARVTGDKSIKRRW